VEEGEGDEVEEMLIVGVEEKEKPSEGDEEDEKVREEEEDEVIEGETLLEKVGRTQSGNEKFAELREERSEVLQETTQPGTKGQAPELKLVQQNPNDSKRH
jgi:hypothetical protein